MTFGSDIATNPGQLYRMVEVIVKAGLYMDAEKNHRNVDFTDDDVEEWVSDLPTSGAMKLISAYTDAFNAKEEQIPNELNLEAKKKTPRGQ
jgi:hypothetical protein